MKKLVPNDQVLPTSWSAGDWTLLFTKAGMLNTAENEKFASAVKVRRIPDAFYGYNSLYLVNSKRDFVYKMAATEMLELCCLEVRKSHSFLSLEEGKTIEEMKPSVDEENEKCSARKEIYNPINAIPTTVLAKQSEMWQKKDFSKIKDFQHIEVTDDWTYTTPYKGSLNYLSTSPIPNYSAKHSTEASLVNTYPTSNEIPFHKLGKDNPVLHFDEVHFFEDDLDDLGFAQAMVRFRVMADNFYVLLRNYVRVDGLIVRVMDTRVYHELGSNELLREFQYKECSYEGLMAKGFGFSSEWILNPAQSDKVFPMLDLKVKFMDKIVI
eukprot:TRINITY_DN7700_c0_g1_i1.p1 TRINITY_DN7700_c0_g1~~TRINITY_DN7700_c0_g1_i1.p1  ORF type:complete len:324 (+),score=105.32 TRINITY_DN7700_c0_g1_i1:83-1054(+)